MSLNLKYTTKEIIEQFIKKHGDTYLYDKVDYKGIKIPVEIICRQHGSFWQTPDNHKKGNGCPDCGGTKKKTYEQFEKEANAVHKNKYKYFGKYINARTKVPIECPIHGIFWQTPHMHLSRKRKQGCPSCSGNKKGTYEQFEKEANAVHKNKYKYFGKYINARTKVPIECPIHGIFWQTPWCHLKGQGCSDCYEHGIYTWKYFEKNPEEKNKPASLYWLHFRDSNEGKFSKIGITTKKIKHRFSLNTLNYKTKKLWKGTLYECFKAEQKNIELFNTKLYKPLLLKNNGASECFKGLKTNQVEKIVEQFDLKEVKI